jgi:molybdopterin-guanine dinucleotide biosynthesis protein B
LNPSNPPPVLGLAARSGTGKTTLLTGLIPALARRGLRCAVIKHSHHDFEIDVPGKDSHRLRAAGAAQVLLASPHRTFWVEEGDGHTEPGLPALLARLNTGALDLVLVEGFRDAAVAKIEVHRPARGLPLLCTGDPHVIAVACDAPPGEPVDVPLLPLNDPDAVAAFVQRWFQGAADR